MAGIQVAVVGASGRMGRQVIKAIQQADEHYQLCAALSHSQSAALGIDSGVLASGQPNQVAVSADFAALSAAAVVIDFSLPEGLEQRLAAYVAAQCPALICVTGLTAEDEQALQQAAKHIPLLYAANTSVGINLLAALTEQAARVTGSSADIEIFEAHHTRKQDAPSGTALLLGAAAAVGRGVNLAEVAAYDRNGANQQHQPGSIGFATIRAGDIVGEHTVFLVLGGERIELTHRVADRSTFAEGALRAASWLAQGQKVGFYAMKHALGID